MLFTELNVTFEVSWVVLFSYFFVMPMNNMGVIQYITESNHNT